MDPGLRHRYSGAGVRAVHGFCPATDSADTDLGDVCRDYPTDPEWGYTVPAETAHGSPGAAWQADAHCLVGDVHLPTVHDHICAGVPVLLLIVMR